MAKNVEAAKKELRPLKILSLLKKKFSSLCDVCMRETEHARTHTHTHTHTKQNYNQNLVWLFTAAYHLTTMFADFFSSLGFMQSLKIWESL